MTPIKFEEAYRRLTRQLAEIILDTEEMELEPAIDIFISEFKNVPIAYNNINSFENDTLVFKYGQKQEKGQKAVFIISVTRQIFQIDTNIKEYGFDISFDVNKVEVPKKTVITCKTKDLCDNWKQEIKASEGFKRTNGLKFTEWLFRFE